MDGLTDRHDLLIKSPRRRLNVREPKNCIVNDIERRQLPKYETNFENIKKYTFKILIYINRLQKMLEPDPKLKNCTIELKKLNKGG